MSWLTKIQNKSREQKIRIIWIAAIAGAVLLIVLWIFTSKIGETLPKDTSLFKEMGRGFKDIRDSYNK